MVDLKQSTSVVVTFGPFVDRTDGYTFETALAGTSANQLEHTSSGILIAKNGGTLAARHAAATASTYDAYGMYKVTLDATDTNTLGTLRVCFGNNDALPQSQDFSIMPANVWDSLYGADLLQVDVTQILGTAVSTPATAGLLDVNVKQVSTDATAADNMEAFFEPGGNVAFIDIEVSSRASETTLADEVVNILAAIAGVQSDTDNIQTRIPAALVGGRIDASVGAMAAGVVTAAAIATGAVDADALATDAVNEIADGVWDEATAGHVTAGTTGKALIDAGAAGTPPTAAAIADAVWDELLAAHVIAGSAGAALGTASAGGDPWAVTAETTFTYGQLVRIIAAATAGLVQGAPDSPIFRNVSDDQDQITGTVDSSGNRTTAIYGS